ncbi:hypothetical protein CRG98_042158 [Punica granatum]|uniref:Uncharacterized protein n=1 Tax=Punica granatum TaxID=22663 RepID=A0A2I0I0S8_PUNGR|nr:hypothetical protein CRG98_042158 [Punica granatum]
MRELDSSRPRLPGISLAQTSESAASSCSNLGHNSTGSDPFNSSSREPSAGTIPLLFFIFKFILTGSAVLPNRRGDARERPVSFARSAALFVHPVAQPVPAQQFGPRQAAQPVQQPTVQLGPIRPHQPSPVEVQSGPIRPNLPSIGPV